MPDHVRARIDGRLGRITLDRPAAVNALTLEMIRDVAAALRAWVEDPRVEVVVLDGAGERGFCAGGDLLLARAAALGDREAGRTYWREEYTLDRDLARYPKPVVALMDGVVMGGGFGLAGRADLRVVTARTRLAMPEVAIGIAPDVGSADLLAAAPGELGTHVALTAAHLGAGDAILCGLADVEVDAADLDALVAALGDGGDPAGVGARFARPRSAAPLAHDRPWIDACYPGDDVAAVVTRLADRPEPRARAAAATITAHAPTGTAVALRALREARREPGLEPCLLRDHRTILRMLDHPDFAEGVTAKLVERRDPVWSPVVDPDFVASCFAPSEDDLPLLG